VIVVADTSVILNLCCIQHEHLLQALFGRVLIPNEVASEFTRLAGTDKRFANLTLPLWTETLAAPPPSREVLDAKLDTGETAAIALCLSTQADLLLIDETLGRSVANRLGIKTVGILGILLDAYQRGHIPRVSPILDRLEREAGFWVSPALRSKILARARE
jgi:predicted nucleic acid-binding protein